MLGIYQGTVQKEELEYRTGFFQERVNEYKEGQRPFQRDTEQFVSSLKEKQEELLEELQEREKEEKKLTPIPDQFEESPKKLVIERKPSYQELQKSENTKPEQLFKGKGKEIEEAQLPPTEKPEQQTMMAAEKHDFKPPKSKPYSGMGQDKDPETFEQWKQEVQDYFDLTSMPPSKHIQALEYFVNDTARDYYHTKRRKHSDTNPVTVDEMLKGIKNHCIPTTSSNVYWKQWHQVSQIQHGKVQRIGVTAIEIDRIAERLHGLIPDTIKLQKFLDVMHPELRHAIEPGINKDKFDWEEIVALAEQQNDSLFQAGKYGKQGGLKKAETFAITQHNQQ